MEKVTNKVLPTIKQFKYISKINKPHFSCLGHSQNYLAQKLGFKDYNSIKPYLRDFYITEEMKEQKNNNKSGSLHILNLIQNEYDTPNCVYSLSFHNSENFLNYVIGYNTLNIEHLYKDKLNNYINVLEKTLTDIKLPDEVIINYTNDFKKEYGENINVNIDDIKEEIKKEKEMYVYYFIEELFEMLEKDVVNKKYNGSFKDFYIDKIFSLYGLGFRFHRTWVDYYFYTNKLLEPLIKLYYLKYKEVLINY